MKLFKVSKAHKNVHIINGLTFFKSFSTIRTQPNKSFLINKEVNKVNKDKDNNVKIKNSEQKNIKLPAKQETKLNLTEEQIKKLAEKIQAKKDSLPTPAKIKENYACVYYKLPMDQEFNLFNLRNLLYGYIFTKQRKGDFYLNFADSTCKEDSEYKNKKVGEVLKYLDWLDISLDFNDKFKNQLFETQRYQDYSKWLKYLIGQKDAYKCFCKNYKKCEGNCADSRENIENDDFKNNKDVVYVRFKNQNRNYKYYDYMVYEDKEFDSSSLGDFLLYKNFNNQFLDSFKRVIDDDIFSVTHIIDEKVI